MIGTWSNLMEYFGGGSTPSAITNNEALDSFYTALASRESTPVDMLIVGGSISERFNAGYGTGYQDILIQNLRSTYSTSGVTDIGGSNYVPAFYSTSPSAWTGTQPYNSALDTGTINSGASGLFSGHINTLSSVGASRTYEFKILPSSTAVEFTNFELFYAGWTGIYGSFVISIDGGTTEGVNQFTLTSTGSNVVSKFSSPTLSAGAHTVKLTGLTLGAAGHAVAYSGFRLFNGDSAKGLRSIDCSHQSWMPSTFNSNSAFDALTQMTSVKLIVVDAVTNAYISQRAIATFKTDVTTMISTIRTKSGNATCPVLAVIWTNPGTADLTIPFSDYVTAMEEVCTAQGYALLSFGPLGLTTCPKSPTATGDQWSADRIHPSTTGHDDIGDMFSAEVHS